MAEKVCLDTDVCISIIKGEKKAEKAIELIGSGKIFVASVTVFELYLRKENLDEVINFLDGIFVLNFNNNCAIKASNIYKDLKLNGITIELMDIFIASTAAVNDCVLATFNKKHFSKIKDLELLEL